MANTYTQIYIQIVFAVEGRQCLIKPQKKEELHAYFIGMKPNINLPDLVGDIKTGSTNHINENKWISGRFAGQEGFGAFSYAHSQLSDVIEYVQNQEKHHAKKSFRE